MHKFTFEPVELLSADVRNLEVVVTSQRELVRLVSGPANAAVMALATKVLVMQEDALKRRRRELAVLWVTATGGDLLTVDDEVVWVWACEEVGRLMQLL